jgi:hypothetical protein
VIDAVDSEDINTIFAMSMIDAVDLEDVKAIFAVSTTSHYKNII